MKKRIVVDTCVFIEEIRKGSKLFEKIIKNIEDTEVLIPSVVLMELWAGKSMGINENIKIMKRYLVTFSEILPSIIPSFASSAKVTKFFNGSAKFCAETKFKKENVRMLTRINNPNNLIVPSLFIELLC